MSYLAAGLTAVGANSAAALVLNTNAKYNQITAGASTTGVRIPSNQPSGAVFEIRNDVSNSINVYPPTTGCINALAADIPYVLPAYANVKFVVGSSITTVVGPPATIVPQVFTFGDQVYVPRVIAVADTKVLLPSESGSIIMASSAQAYAITLPAVATSAGLNYKIIKSDAVAFAVSVSSAAANIVGTLTYGDAGLNSVDGGTHGLPITATAVVRFIAGARIGDSMEFVCNGTNWFCKAQTSLILGIVIV